MTLKIDLGFVEDPSKPILALSLDVFETQCADKHKHPRAQMIYSSKGNMKVILHDRICLVSPS